MILIRLVLTAALLTIFPMSLQAQSTHFSYQGQIQQAGTPFSGTVDLQFRLFDDDSGGIQIGTTQSLNETPVQAGLFQVELDFGLEAFGSEDRFMVWRSYQSAPAPSTSSVIME